MRILFFNQFFYPDLAPTSQLLTDLARELCQAGHDVTVISGKPAYAKQNCHKALPDVRTLAVPTVAYSRTTLGRLSSYIVFFLGALWNTCRIRKPDLVVTMTTPPLISVLGTLVKRLRGAKHFIWEMDLYPEVAVDLGLIKENSLRARLIGAIADAQRRAAEGVIVLGECMRTRLIARGLDERKLQVVDNWADGEIFFPRPKSADRALSLIYPGNFGLGHDQQTLIDALPSIDSDSRFRLTFIGGGPRYDALRTLCQARNWKSIEFKGYCSPSELAASEFPKTNVGLILQDGRCSGSIVPSKLYPMLAAGLPVLFIGPESATPARIIQRFSCGWFLPPGDSTALLNLLRRLTDAPDEIITRSERARTAFLEHFDRPLALARIKRILGLQLS